MGLVWVHCEVLEASDDIWRNMGLEEHGYVLGTIGPIPCFEWWLMFYNWLPLSFGHLTPLYLIVFLVARGRRPLFTITIDLGLWFETRASFR